MIEMKKAFTASKYQQEVFDRVVKGGRYIVAAGPGCGKSKTIEQALRFVPGGKSVLCTAFNVSAAEGLQAGVNESLEGMQNPPSVTVLNIHKVGGQTLTTNWGKREVDTSKYRRLAKGYYENKHLDPADFKNEIEQIVKLAEKARICLTDETNRENVFDLIERFLDIDADGDEYDTIIDDLMKALPYVIKNGIQQAISREHKIDLTDMIWLPVRLKMKPFQYFDYLFLDEAQDFTPCERALLLSCAKDASTIFCVGDRRQSINVWKGAQAGVMDLIKADLNAEELPLSVCYRCPKSVVALANTVFPGLESPEGQEEGVVEQVHMSAFVEMAQAGDVFLGRWNAPLVSLCIDLLISGKRANVRGRDMGASVKTLLDKVRSFNRQFTPERFMELPKFLQEYESYRAAELERHEGNETKIDALADQVRVAELLFNAYASCFSERGVFLPQATYARFTKPVIRNKYRKVTGYGEFPTSLSLDNFKITLENFFEDDPDAQIILMTVHKAKGSQNPRIFILDYDKLPSRTPKKGKRKMNMYEEQCIEYVAVTRAQKALYLGVTSVQIIDEPEEIAETVISEETPEVEQPTITKKKTGRPSKDRARVNIKLDTDLQKLTEDIDRSELINQLLRAHYGLDN